MAFWSRLTSIVGGAAVARAASETLAPQMEAILQDAWQAMAIRQLDVNELGRIAAEELATEGEVLPFAQRQGYAADKVAFAAELSRTAPGIPEVLQMLNRGLITQADVDEAMKKHAVQPRWRSAWSQLHRFIISPQIYANLWLKGWLTQGEAVIGGALSGATPGDVDLMYKSTSRPAANQQMATAVARGVPGPDGPPMDYAQFVKGIKESDIRTEWADMLWGIRFAYPPLFQINRLVQAGAIDGPTALLWAKNNRMAPEVLTALGKYWGGTQTGGGKELTAAQAQTEYEGGFIDQQQLSTILQALGYSANAIALLLHLGDARRVSTARGRAITAIEKAYLAHDISAGQATADLGATGLTGQAISEILALWDLELGLSRRQLSNAEITRAYRRNVISQATALAELEARGYTVADANQILGGSFTAISASIVQKLYKAGTIDHTQAVAFLTEGGYTPAEITALVG
jgi:hypothetical protein